MTTPTRDELLKLADQYAAATGNIYAEAAQDPSKTARMAEVEREALRTALLSAHQAQAEPVSGQAISVDVSTCDGDAGNRIFAQLTGKADGGTGWLAIEISRNFTAPSSDQTWNEVLERAADLVWNWAGLAEHEERRKCCDAIRALARPSQAQEPSEQAAFLAHLEKSSQTVKGWPSWKQQAPSQPVSGALGWLERTMRCGVPEVEHAARTCYAFYQGAEFPEPVSGAVDDLPEQFSLLIADVCDASYALGRGAGYGQQESDKRSTTNAAIAALKNSIAAISRAQQAPAVPEGACKAVYSARRKEVTVTFRTAEQAAAFQDCIFDAWRRPAAAPVSEQTTQEKP